MRWMVVSGLSWRCWPWRFASVVLGLVGACGPDAGIDAVVDGRVFVSDAVRRDGSEQPLSAGTYISLSFHNDRVSIDVGCNGMVQPYDFDRDGSPGAQQGSGRTDMRCSNDTSALEDWLPRFLNVADAKIAGNKLTLSDESAEVVLVDRRVASVGLQLVSTHWVLEHLVKVTSTSVSPAVDAFVRLTFGAPPGQITLVTGCGLVWEANYTLIGKTLQISHPDTRGVEGCAAAVLAATRGGAEATMSVLGRAPVTASVDWPVLTLSSSDTRVVLRAGT
jgi:META domain